MKKLIVLVLLLPVLCKAQVKRILFIGNSYTSVNNLPQTFKDLALSGGDSVYIDSNMPGGYTFQQHVSNSATLSKIAQGNWDYVILQEQSQLPSFPPSQVETDVFPYAKILDSLINNSDSCAETVFYMTWGRKYGDQSNCASYPPLCTYEGMQLRLRESYLQMGDNNNATVSPVGMAWRASRNTDSTINLYSADYSHPSTAGTYLTACVFYSTLYKKSSVGLSYISSLSPATAGFLQQIATQTVFDSLSNWNVDIDHPAAGFEWNVVSGNTVNFTDTSFNHDSANWYIDGQFYSGSNVIHTFPGPGTYAVCIISGNNCFSDTLCSLININVNSIEEIKNEKWKLFPNPAFDILKIDGITTMVNFEIINTLGEIVLSGKTRGEIQISSLVQGMYFLRIGGDKKKQPVSFIKT